MSATDSEYGMIDTNEIYAYIVLGQRPLVLKHRTETMPDIPDDGILLHGVMGGTSFRTREEAELAIRRTVLYGLAQGYRHDCWRHDAFRIFPVMKLGYTHHFQPAPIEIRCIYCHCKKADVEYTRNLGKASMGAALAPDAICCNARVTVRTR